MSKNANKNKRIRHPIVELGIDGATREFLADSRRRVYISLDDERESYHETVFNAPMKEILVRHSITVH